MKKNPITIIRLGLACVFLANGLAALFAPQEFKDLIEGSFILHWFSVSVAAFLWFIGINNILIAILLSLNKYSKIVAAWAMLWIIAATIVTQDIPGILEHVGFFSMALALWVSN
jgi:hypothetical protein